jgi:hypothetical protein
MLTCRWVGAHSRAEIPAGTRVKISYIPALIESRNDDENVRRPAGGLLPVLLILNLEEMGQLIKRMLEASLIVLASTILHAQDRPVWLKPWGTVEKPLNCEENNLHLDLLANLTTVEGPRDGALIVIARLGDGERSQQLNLRRLHNVQVGLLDNRRIDPARVILTSGDRVAGSGRVEFYLGGKLMGVLRIERGKDICVACCDIDERYYPYRAKKKRQP